MVAKCRRIVAMSDGRNTGSVGAGVYRMKARFPTSVPLSPTTKTLPHFGSTMSYTKTTQDEERRQNIKYYRLCTLSSANVFGSLLSRTTLQK